MGGQDLCQASQVGGVWVAGPERDEERLKTRVSLVQPAHGNLPGWLHPPRLAPMQSGFVWDAVPGDLGSCVLLHHGEGEALPEGLFQPGQQPPRCLAVRKESFKHASLKRFPRRRVTFLEKTQDRFTSLETPFELCAHTQLLTCWIPSGMR